MSYDNWKLSNPWDDGFYCPEPEDVEILEDEDLLIEKEKQHERNICESMPHSAELQNNAAIGHSLQHVPELC
jgi:hypothetical protein